MLVRVVTVFIVLFWAASIGWLCSVVWAPPGSRMAAVDAREVYDVFFNWNDTVDMTLLENGVRRGQITASGGSGIDSSSNRLSNFVSFSGSMNSFRPAEADSAVSLFWNGVAKFTEDLALDEAELSLRIPRRFLVAHFAVEGEPRSIKARATLGEKELFRFDGEAGAPLPANLLPFGSMMGLSVIDPANLELKVDAGMGDFKFEGRTMRAYLLRVRATEQGQEVRIFLSEAGEPLRIETDFGFEAISEILVPLDVHQPNHEKAAG
ncbi:MAG: hypothetical protein WD342_04620 [Verrucomicrobiales bacterium]